MPKYNARLSLPTAITCFIIILLATACNSGGSEISRTPLPPVRNTQMFTPAPSGTQPPMTQPPIALMASPTYMPQATSGTGATAASPNSPAQRRIILKNATLILTVDDPSKEVNRVAQLAEAMGGWVVNSIVTKTVPGNDEQERIQGSIIVRVPAEQLDSALEQIKAGAIFINSENVTGNDVTAQYVDLASQLASLQSAQDQLLKIMDKAATIDEILKVQDQLTTIRSQIEVIQGQLKFYSEAAAYSLINVTFNQKQILRTPTPTPTATVTPTPTPKPLGLVDWSPGDVAVSAVDKLVSLVQIVIYLLIWLIIFAVPIAIVLTVGRLTLRILRRK